MARRRESDDMRNHLFQGRLYSMNDICINCGYRLGLHKGGDIAECPRDATYAYHDPDYYRVRGTAFLLFPTLLMVPDGA